MDVDIADPPARPAVAPRESRVQACERERQERGPEEEQERLPIREPVPVDLDRIAQCPLEVLDVQASIVGGRTAAPRADDVVDRLRNVGPPPAATVSAVTADGRTPGRIGTAIVGLVLTLALLAALVHTGKLTGVDQFGLDHLMPWLDPGQTSSNTSAGLWRPFKWSANWWSKILDLWTYPCSVLISALVMAAFGAFEWRRGRRLAALLPGAAWVAGNGVEVIGKHWITRPALYGVSDGVRLHVGSFDNSFPSGHMMRGILIAAVIALVWRRSSTWVALWALLVGPALVLQSAHTPSDVVGGALVAAILVLLGWALIESPLSRRWPELRPSSL